MNGNGKTVERPDPLPPLASVNDEGVGEEEWMMDSPPDIVLLNPSSKRRRVEMDEDEDELVMTTPSKPSISSKGPKRRCQTLNRNSFRIIMMCITRKLKY